MRIDTIHVRNYGAFYGAHTFRIADRGLCLVLGDNQDEPRMNSNGCLTGDTLIDCPRDLKKYPKGIPIHSLVGKRPWVYAWESGRVVIRRASKVWLTKRRTRVTRVKLSKYATKRGSGQGGKYLPPQELVGTPEHPVLLSDGKTWKALGDLRPGDRLCSLYRRESGGWRTLLYWTGSGLMPMGDRVGPKTVSEQQFVCSEVYGSRPEGMEVHHRNGNPYDHRPANLEWIKTGEHQSGHTSERNRLGLAGWKVSGRHPRGMLGKKHTPEKRAQISESLRKSWQKCKAVNGPNHTVISTEPAGYRDVYDMTVPGADSFVANGVVVHNSGKSTIFEAMDWCLFGKVPRGDHADSIINEEAGGDCQVSTNIIDDAGKLITVTRYRGVQGKSGVELYYDGVQLTALDVKETQRMIEERLGLDRDVFHAAVLFGQFDLLRFADAKDSERMGILTKILQLEQIDDWLERAKEAEREVGTRRAQLDREINQITGRVGMAEQQIPGLEQQARGIEDGRAVKLREATVQLNKHMEYQVGYEKMANQEEQARRNLDMAEDMGGLNGELNLLEWDGPDGKVTRAAREERALSEQRAVVTNQGHEVSARIKKFESMRVGDCSECGQPITGEHVAMEIGKLTSARKHMRETFTQLDKQLQEKAQIRQVAEQEREQYRKMHMDADRAATAKMEEARRQLQQVKEAQRSLKQNRDYIDSLRQTMEETRTKENPYYTQLEEVQSLVARAKEQLAAYEAEVVTELENQAYYTFWTEAFGPRGLKSYILDARLHDMTEAANHWVRILTGGTIWIRFETQTLGRSTKKLTNKINVRVFRYNPTGTISERNYRSWSGGEKQRVSLGIDFGLTRLIANRASKRYDVLILDELFKHLDRAGREAVMEMLHHLRKEKSSVICIDHDETFQGAFEDRVLMTKKNQRTTIRELDYVEAEPTSETTGDAVRAVPAVSQAVG